MRPMVVVMTDVLGEDGLEMTAAEDQHVVEALTTEGSDDALTDRIGPGRSDGDLHDPDGVGSEDIVEGPGELGVAHPDQGLEWRRPFGELEEEVPRC